MSAVNGTRSPAETRGGATSTSQARRLQWEQQWLRANRDAQRVVRSDEHVATQERPAAAAVNVPEGEVRSAGTPPQLPVSVPTGASTAVESRASVPVEINGGAPAALRPDTVAAPNVWQRTESDFSARSADGADTRGAGPMAREQFKQFALWYDEKKVGVALRLPDTVTSGSVIGQLRKWLRDAGLTLVNVMINGKVHWRHERPPRDGF